MSDAMALVPFQEDKKSSKNKSKDRKKRSAPHLPEKFLEALRKEKAMDGFQTWAFSEAMHNIRLDFANIHRTEPRDPDEVTTLNELPHNNPMYGTGRTLLHHAVVTSDHVVVYEMLRFGASPNKLDAKGDNPLSLALDFWFTALRCLPTPYHNHRTAFYARMRHIVNALLKQHADVNVQIHGMTALHRACKIGDWGLIGAILEHGAERLPPQDPEYKIGSPATFLRPGDRPRLGNIWRTCHGRGAPPRACPCWSGKPLALCHVPPNDVAYPEHFRCICGSGKSYGSCSCIRRETAIVERFNPAHNRIEARFTREVPFDPRMIPEMRMHANPLMAESFKIMDNMATLLDIERPDDEEGEAARKAGMEKVRKMAIELTLKGQVDPAYTYALYKSDKAPRPQGRTIDKISAKEQQRIWNGYVDDYIALGIDKRPELEIERVAKLGPSLGTMHPVCDHPNCAKMKGRDVERLMGCSGCQVTLYCSTKCQKEHWVEHRLHCRPNLREQMLPSQANMMLYSVQQVAIEWLEKFKTFSPRKMAQPNMKLFKAIVTRFAVGEPLTPEIRACCGRVREVMLGLKNRKMSVEEFWQTTVGVENIAAADLEWKPPALEYELD